MPYLRLICYACLILPLYACFDDSDDDDDTQSATDISDVNLSKRSGDCSDYVGKYESNVTDVKRGIGFMGDITITATDTHCTINSNDIPNHDFNDANASFATNVDEVDKSFTMPINPSEASSNTELALGVVNVVLLNGVVVDILPAACYGEGNGQTLGEEKIGCEGDQIDNPWRYDPMSSLNSFGTDSHNAHVQPDGTYHYHGNPVALFAQNCSSESSASPVIGFAADGFPVYGSCIDDGNSGIRQVTSSYQLKTGARQAVSPYSTPVSGQGNIDSANYDGQFRGDYEYSASLGDLDECNGMTVDGQYGYYVSNTFPWIVNCYKGTVQESFKPANQQAMEIKMHGHDHN
jgi:hypothetical protein